MAEQTLKTPKAIAGTVTKKRLKSMMYDFELKQFYFTVSEHDATGRRVMDRVIRTVSPGISTAVIRNINDYVAGGATALEAMERALYDEEANMSGDEGTVA